MTQEQFLVFDIETMALPFDTLSESQQEYITRSAATEEEKEKKKSEMALSPMTSRVICLGMQFMQGDGNGGFNLTGRTAYSLDDNLDEDTIIQGKLSTGDDIYLCSERKILDTFWKILKKYPNLHLISFNGRNFDAPFLMLRSAVLRLRPSRNIMSGTKFNYPLHTDLIDELCFYTPSSYGATRRYNFDFFTRAFGITSPKSEGIDGSKVADYFRDGRINEISEYCLRDVKATWELYQVWREFLKF
jgi:predicted PolB exonuclease-like 3'-5' exonuclease